MSEAYITKDTFGNIIMQANKPDTVTNGIFWYWQGGKGPGEQLSGPLVDRLVKGLNLRRGKYKFVKLVEVTNDQ